MKRCTISYCYSVAKYITIPEQATNGPTALARAPSERNIPITFPFSSSCPAHKMITVIILITKTYANLYQTLKQR